MTGLLEVLFPWIIPLVDLVALGPLIWLSAMFGLCVLVSLVFLGCLARIVGGFYLVSCPGCGLQLSMAGMLVVLLGRPFVGLGFVVVSG